MSGILRPARATTHLVSAVLASLLPVFALSGVPASAAPAPLAVTWSNVPDQVLVDYSDSVPSAASFSATTGRTGGASVLSASSIGLPGGLGLTKTVSGATATWTITGAVTDDPGSYDVELSVTDTSESDEYDVTLVVSQESATVAYSGPTNVVGPDAEADDIPVTITAVVTQEADGQLGSIGTGTVDFYEAVEDEEMCTDVAITPTSAGQGTATCTYGFDPYDEDYVDYQVQMTVDGSYTGTSTGSLRVAYPPEIELETGISGPQGWVLGKATFGYTSNVADSTFVCRLDFAPVSCASPSVTLTGLTQRSHHFTVAAKDSDDYRDDTPAVRDFGVPLDDTALAGPWKHKKAGSAYGGTFSTTKKKGATLTYKVANARELALVVQTGKSFGKVKVYLDDTLLKAVSLKGGGGTKVVDLASFASGRSGTLKIVCAGNKVVRVDGLGVSAVPLG